jgi:hypothetical protein
MFSSTAIEIIVRLKMCSCKAKVFPHLEARFCVGRGIPPSKDSLSLYSKDTYVKKTKKKHKCFLDCLL